MLKPTASLTAAPSQSQPSATPGAIPFVELLGAAADPQASAPLIGEALPSVAESTASLHVVPAHGKDNAPGAPAPLLALSSIPVEMLGEIQMAAPIIAGALDGTELAAEALGAHQPVPTVAMVEPSLQSPPAGDEVVNGSGLQSEDDVQTAAAQEIPVIVAAVGALPVLAPQITGVAPEAPTVGALPVTGATTDATLASRQPVGNSTATLDVASPTPAPLVAPSMASGEATEATSSMQVRPDAAIASVQGGQDAASLAVTSVDVSSVTAPTHMGGQAMETRVDNLTRLPPVLPQVQMPASPDEGFNEVLGARMTLMVEQTISHARIRISPEHLGAIDLQLTVEGDKVTATFNSQHADVRTALEAGMSRLRDQLAEQGLQLAHAQVGSQSHGGASNSRDEGEVDALAIADPGTHDDVPITAPTIIQHAGLVSEYA